MRIFIASSIERFPDTDGLFIDLSAIRGSKPVKTEELHLTFRFFGDVEDKALDAIIHQFEDLNCSRFSLKIRGIGAFPRLERANVLFLKVESNEPMEKDWLAVNSIAPAADRKEKFVPHITVSRFKVPANCVGLNEKYRKIEYERDIDKISLYSSVLTKEGPAYSVLASLQLK